MGLHKDASINDEVVTENDTKNVTKNVTENVTEHLTDRQLKIIELIRKDATISTGTIAEQCNVTKMTIKRDIDKMSHIVVHIGPKNGGKWEIIFMNNQKVSIINIPSLYVSLSFPQFHRA